MASQTGSHSFVWVVASALWDLFIIYCVSALSLHSIRFIPSRVRTRSTTSSNYTPGREKSLFRMTPHAWLYSHLVDSPADSGYSHQLVDPISTCTQCHILPIHKVIVWAFLENRWWLHWKVLMLKLCNHGERLNNYYTVELVKRNIVLRIFIWVLKRSTVFCNFSLPGV